MTFSLLFWQSHLPSRICSFVSEVPQLCPTLWDPMGSLSCSSIHGIFQARVLESVAISFSRGSSLPRGRTQVSRIVSKHFIVWATREAQSIPNYSSFLKTVLIKFLHLLTSVYWVQPMAFHLIFKRPFKLGASIFSYKWQIIGSARLSHLRSYI